ncbi:hypothetical protein FRACYDRAFT_249507 [Fragilariopsis cylindrus CCMP1102]|uniref:Arrestin-like N-terminal domain-containing protein n=1 Tax=Fragilariopsis cylindrus CCMP1102 TaxID=635003 RepID=A0A1E7ERZ5_9STRA|nr:hypothetical protein FRACYDRAFT_249507 [Fragilariopsis cylindrus CCMP1102]|eukprot:OEU08615.1 hypothetical protein FRACYDRAFT_249507 [Fragilariopsis cylindrus CCMP1102]
MGLFGKSNRTTNKSKQKKQPMVGTNKKPTFGIELESPIVNSGDVLNGKVWADIPSELKGTRMSIRDTISVTLPAFVLSTMEYHAHGSYARINYKIKMALQGSSVFWDYTAETPVRINSASIGESFTLCCIVFSPVYFILC